MRKFSSYCVMLLFLLGSVLLRGAVVAEPVEACPERFRADVIEFVKDADAAKEKRVGESLDLIEEYRLCEISVADHTILKDGGFYVYYRDDDPTYYIWVPTHHSSVTFGPLELED